MNDVSTPEAIEMLSEVSGVSGIEPATKFGSLNLDSLMLIEWVSLIEETIDVEFNIRDLDLTGLTELSINDVLEGLRQRAIDA